MENSPDEKVEYDRGTLGKEDLRAEIDAFFEALNSGDEAIAEDAAANEIDLAELQAASPDDIRIEERGGGFTGVAEVLLLFFLRRGLDLGWEKVIKPYIDRRHGGDAMGERKQPV